MTLVELLVAARAKIAIGWTQYRYARDVTGGEVPPVHLDACRWCAIGALVAARSLLPEAAERLALMVAAKSALRAVVHDCVQVWNDADGRTQQEVIEAFDAAIAAEMSGCALREVL